MIYCNQVPKRDLLNKNLRFYQVGNYVFGAQTIEMNEMTCCNENLQLSVKLTKNRLRITKVAF